MSINYDRKRRKADRMIKKWGGSNGILRRTVSGSASDRECVVVVIDFSDRRGGRELLRTDVRRAILSALKPDGSLLLPPPEMEKDQLVLVNKETGAEKVCRIMEDPKETAPDSTTIVFWELVVSK